MEDKLQGFITYLKAERNASPYTVKSYRGDLVDFLLFLRREEIEALEAVDHLTLRHFLAWLQQQGLSKRSMARKLSAIRSFYRYLMREGFVASNPLAGASSPKLEKRLPYFLTLEEIQLLLRAPDTSTPQGLRDIAIMELLYASGLRLSEIVGLDLTDFDLRNREVRVMGKGSKERVVVMGKPAAAALDLYLREARPKLLANKATKAFFLNRYGKRIAGRRIQYRLVKYARQVGLEKKVHPHLFRHSFATHLLDGGADLRVVQELLGHALLSSTQVYTHVSQSQARKVYLRAHPRAKEKEQ